MGIALHPTDPNIAICGTQDTGTNVFSNSIRWARRQRGDGGVSIIYPLDPRRVYQVREDSTILFSRALDGGRTFPTSNGVVDDPANEDRLLIGTTRVLLSTDGGLNWKPITSTNNNGWTTTEAISALAIATIDPRIVYAAAGGHMFYTADSAADTPTWLARVVYTAGLAFCSTDGGKSWRAATGNLPAAGTHGRGVWQTLISAHGPTIAKGGVVIHGGVANALSPGSLVNICGSNLATATASAAAGPPLPLTLGGAQVLVNGVASPLIVSPNQMIFQLPAETAVGTATVVVSSAAGDCPLQVAIGTATSNRPLFALSR